MITGSRVAGLMDGFDGRPVLGTNSLSVLMCRKAVNQSIEKLPEAWSVDHERLITSSRVAGLMDDQLG